MTKSIKQLQGCVVKIAAIVSDKGWRDAKAEFQIKSDGRFCIMMRAGHPKSYEWNDGIFETTYGATPPECIARAIVVAAKIENVSTKEKQDFLKSLGLLIDKGRKVGVEVELLNPLTAAMKKLSENILTDQSQ